MKDTKIVKNDRNRIIIFKKSQKKSSSPFLFPPGPKKVNSFNIAGSLRTYVRPIQIRPTITLSLWSTFMTWNRFRGHGEFDEMKTVTLVSPVLFVTHPIVCCSCFVMAVGPERLREVLHKDELWCRQIQENGWIDRDQLQEWSWKQRHRGESLGNEIEVKGPVDGN